METELKSPETKLTPGGAVLWIDAPFWASAEGRHGLERFYQFWL
jgi:hypothetical protein